MFTASAKWTEKFQFESIGNSGHKLLVDGDSDDGVELWGPEGGHA